MIPSNKLELKKPSITIAVRREETTIRLHDREAGI